MKLRFQDSIRPDVSNLNQLVVGRLITGSFALQFQLGIRLRRIRAGLLLPTILLLSATGFLLHPNDGTSLLLLGRRHIPLLTADITRRSLQSVCLGATA